MARYIGALLLAALALWTGEALGACAWVLWEEKEEIRAAHEVETVRNWTIHGARQTQAECEEALTPAWQNERDRWEKSYGQLPTFAGVVSKPGSIIVTIRGAGDKTITMLSSQFHCLPDTLDPRGPKGAR